MVSALGRFEVHIRLLYLNESLYSIVHNDFAFC